MTEPICDFCHASDKFRCKTRAQAKNCENGPPCPLCGLVDPDHCGSAEDAAACPHAPAAPSVTIHGGDCRIALQRMIAAGQRVHSVVCDPPYGLKSIIKRFGKEDAAPALHGTDGLYARQTRGFIGQTWDGTERERDPEFWKLVLDVLLPGGYCFAFSGSRTGHWQAVAMEEAGFIIHPVHGWAYGTGFPKAHDAARAVLKAGGDPEDVASWKGWSYGTQAQKPGLEPIYLAQKPMAEKNGGLNMIAHGVGAVNIDGCRVPADGDGEDRWPANVRHDGSDEVRAMFPGAEEASASRFFHAFPPEDGVPPLLYNGKAGKEDRAGSDHPTVKPIKLLQYMVRHVTPIGGTVLDPFAGTGTTAEAARLEGFDCILMESQPKYLDFLRQRFPQDSDMTDLEAAEIEALL